MIVGLIIIYILLTTKQWFSCLLEKTICKKWRYVYRKFGNTQRFNLILKTPKREVWLEWWKWKKLHIERHYEGSHMLFLKSRAPVAYLGGCVGCEHTALQISCALFWWNWNLKISFEIIFTEVIIFLYNFIYIPMINNL